MEPKILIIGAIQSDLDSLATRLEERGQNVLVAKGTEEKIQELLKVRTVDFIIMEPNQGIILDLIRSIDSNIPIVTAELDNWQRVNLLIDQQLISFKKNESELLTMEK